MKREKLKDVKEFLALKELSENLTLNFEIKYNNFAGFFISVKNSGVQCRYMAEYYYVDIGGDIYRAKNIPECIEAIISLYEYQKNSQHFQAL